MRKRNKKKTFIAYLLVISVIFQIKGITVQAETNTAAENEVTVYTLQEFLSALSQKKSPIIIGSTSITIQNGADTNGRMRPIMIPGGTVIRGRTPECQLNSRAPIQLEGDGVVFEDMSLVFESTNALGSVPHREIFLAGHSLTVDNVNTYLEGGDNEFGGLSGTEKELLPTVCAGGYPGTDVGTNASLTVQNSNDYTMFKGIYMGHTDENGDKEPYFGAARLQIDPKTVVREGIYTRENSLASINLEGTGYANAKEFYGNDNTVFTVRQSSVSEAIINGVGSVVLDDGAWLTPESDTLKNVTVKNDSCLDFSGVSDAFVTGNFCGEEAGTEDGETKIGILVLDTEGSLTISGNVTGKTQFQTGHKLFPGVLISQKGYIIAEQSNPEEIPFILSEKSREDGYELNYEDGMWKAYRNIEDDVFEIGSIEIPYAKTEVDLSGITEQTDEEIFCNIIWRDKSGQIIGDDVIDTEYLYQFGYVIPIKTECWESDDPSVLAEPNWSNSIVLERSEDNPENYHFYAFADAKCGNYIFLFFSDLIEEDLATAADVKAKKDLVKAEMRIAFYDSSKGEEVPGHTHSYYETITKKASCLESGIKTFICSGCKDSYTEVIPQTGHTEVIDPAEEATCTEDGKTQGSHCSVCHAVLTAQTAIPKKGHTEVIDPAEEATCAKEGKTQGSHCSVCQTVLTAQTVIPKKAHTEVTDPAEEATCTKEGKTQGSHCSVCNEVIAAQMIIPQKEHNYQTQTVRASVEKAGFSRTVCTLCGSISDESEIVSPKSVVLSSESYIYDGIPKCPSVTVRDRKGGLVDSRYYTVNYVNNKDVGLAEVRVTFRDNYEGVLTETFQILPKPAAMKKLKAGKKGFTVKWKKQTGQITGYMIQYSTNKKFSKKGTKLLTVGNSKASSKKVKKLKGGKKYFVRICTYKTVQSGGKTVTLCSQWSKGKTVKVKK